MLVALITLGTGRQTVGKSLSFSIAIFGQVTATLVLHLAKSKYFYQN